MKTTEPPEIMCACDWCAIPIQQSDIIVFNEELICESCQQTETTVCGGCSGRFLNDEMEGFIDGESFCSISCIHEAGYVACYDCGDWIPRRNSNVVCDEYYCDDCMPDEENCFDFCDEINYRYVHTTQEKTLLDTKGYTIGVELEVLNSGGVTYLENTPQDIIGSKGFYELIGSKEDGSLAENGVEFVTAPSDNDNTYNIVEALTSTLQQNEFSVNKSCGFHLHIGGDKIARPINQHKIFVVYGLFQDALFLMLPPSRQANQFCRKRCVLNPYLFTETAEKDILNYYNLTVGSRYNHLNLFSLRNYGTVEIRSHQGTTNKEKVLNWIKINVALCEFAINTPIEEILSLTGTPNEFKRLVLKDFRLRRYYIERVKEFNYLLPPKDNSLETNIINEILTQDYTGVMPSLYPVLKSKIEISQSLNTLSPYPEVS